MNYLNNRNIFLNDKKFYIILDNFISLYESDDKLRTYEWTFENKSKLEKLLSNLPKKEILNYFDKFLKWVTRLPKIVKSKTIVPILSVFLMFVSVKELISSNQITDDMKIEISNIDINTKADFHVAQKIVKAVEGGYTDDKDDKGNWVDNKLIGTNHGISAPELKSYLGYTPSKEEMVGLKYDDALEIYKKKYWDRNNLGFINNQSVANIIYDGIVNQGRGGTKKVIQDVLSKFGMKVKMRNIFDKETIEDINKLDQEELFNEISSSRWDRYKNTLRFNKYGKGWKNRLDKFKFKKGD